MYAVTVTWSRPGLADPAYTVTGTMPTFYLDENVQGIMSEAHARSIVRAMLLELIPSAHFTVDAVRMSVPSPARR